jgi:hypothetical protein
MIYSLPIEVMGEFIARRLCYRDAMALAATCRRFRALIWHDEGYLTREAAWLGGTGSLSRPCAKELQRRGFNYETVLLARRGGGLLPRELVWYWCETMRTMTPPLTYPPYGSEHLAHFVASSDDARILQGLWKCSEFSSRAYIVRAIWERGPTETGRLATLEALLLSRRREQEYLCLIGLVPREECLRMAELLDRPSGARFWRESRRHPAIQLLRSKANHGHGPQRGG